mmetsp:Transcript_50860/g.83609  ORF Transcript_50860/g.83609 Transcript_50860/m.83609 type:complete len:86 (-) Transcript_50860:251-508(-)
MAFSTFASGFSSFPATEREKAVNCVGQRNFPHPLCTSCTPNPLPLCVPRAHLVPRPVRIMHANPPSVRVVLASPPPQKHTPAPIP